MKSRSLPFTVAALSVGVCALASQVHAQAAPSAQIVGVDNFARAETDTYMARHGKTAGVGKLQHQRELQAVDKQVVIRPNRDTLYSMGLFDLAAGPATLVLPDVGKRYVSVQVISQDHYTTNIYHGAGTYTLTQENVGTRYAYVIIRLFVVPGSADDLKQVHALQDAIRVSQKDPGKLELPTWDAASLKKVRDALLVLGMTAPDANRSFGTKSAVDPVRHLARTASGWGGLPEQEAMYMSRTPQQNDGKTVYKVSVKDVPVDAFWSISVYDAKGYFAPNPEGAYSINNVTARKGSDGVVTLQFGGCDGAKTPNCLPIMPGWSYTVRLYQPRAEAVSGAWKFPEVQPVQ